MRFLGVSPIPRRHGFWSEAPCYACQAPLCTTDPQQRLCAECNWLELQHAAELTAAANGDAWSGAAPAGCWTTLWQLWPMECTT